MIVYKITNKINGKIYIGQTIHSLTTRWRKHCNKSSCKAISRAIQKYGKENFTVEQIDIACDRDELDRKEKYWIEYYNSTNSKKGYNLRSGGEHSVHSENIRKQISNTLKGRKKSLETRIKMSKSLSGRTLSEEHKRNIGLAGIGRRVSKETRLKISMKLKNKPLSEEHKRKLSESHKNGTIPSFYKKVRCVENGKIFVSQKEAGDVMGIDPKQISKVCRGQHKTAGGYRWELIQ